MFQGKLFKILDSSARSLGLTATLLIFSTAALAGPSDGGGTNLVISENELVDFVTFQKDYGGKIQQIDPRKAKIRGTSTPVWADIKPKLERLEYFYPGSKTQLEGAFDKPWIVIDAKFQARNSEEKKVISQTDEAVFVSSDWLKHANPDQIKKAWLHEAVRNWATKVSQDLHETDWCQSFAATKEKGKSAVIAEIADQLTENITPPAFEGGDRKFIEFALNQAVLKSCKTDSLPIRQDFTSRAFLYDHFRQTEPQKIFNKICASVKQKIIHGAPEKELLAMIDQATSAMAEEMAKPGDRPYYKNGFDTKQCNPEYDAYAKDHSLITDPSMDNVRLMFLLVQQVSGMEQLPAPCQKKWANGYHNSPDGTGSYFPPLEGQILQTCKSLDPSDPTLKDFLAQWKKDGGVVRDPHPPSISTDLPYDGDSEPASPDPATAPAK